MTSMFTFLVDQYLQPTGVPVAKLLETPPLGQHPQHSMWACCRDVPIGCLRELPSGFYGACSNTLLANLLGDF